MTDSFAAWVVEKHDDQIRRGVQRLAPEQLPPGDVLIQVHYSSLNYKDALAAQGHRGVVRRFPHVPGIDLAGVVVESQYPGIKPGQEVLVTGYGLGAEHWGGWAQLARVQHQWVIPLPQGLTLRESMILGTAGFTAALALQKLLDWGVEPDAGPVLVTGASGGVGSLAVSLLAQQGFGVQAVSGKQDARSWLLHLGAQEVLPRQTLTDDSGKPLLSARWAAAVDTVGGSPLGVVVRSLVPGGAVAACGVVAGAELPLTVFPFILRGVGLLGVDSAQCPYTLRLQLWQRLATTWKPRHLEEIVYREIGLAELEDHVQAISAGEIRGRVLLRLKETT